MGQSRPNDSQCVGFGGYDGIKSPRPLDALDDLVFGHFTSFCSATSVCPTRTVEMKKRGI
jgi:hypothetical protein